MNIFYIMTEQLALPVSKVLNMIICRLHFSDINSKLNYIYFSEEISHKFMSHSWLTRTRYILDIIDISRRYINARLFSSMFLQAYRNFNFITRKYFKENCSHQ